MDEAITIKLLTSVLLMLLYPTADGYWLPRQGPLRPVRPVKGPAPLCETQFSLADRACALVPYTPGPPPSPRAAETGHHGHRHHHRHGHGHRYGHRHLRPGNGEATQAEEECCRWLKDIDHYCVCEVLVHLPTFLSRPVHNYTVVVEDVCEITFGCGSRLVQV